MPKRPCGTGRDATGAYKAVLAAIAPKGNRLEAALVDISIAALSPNTIAARIADLTSFADHVRQAAGAREGAGGLHLPAQYQLPAKPQTVADWLTRLNKLGQSPATLGRRLATLAAVHQLFGLASPSAEPLVALTLKAIRRQRGTAQRQAAALCLGEALSAKAAKPRSNSLPTSFTLRTLLAACGRDAQGLRDAALMSLGYDCGLRVSELVAVEVDHIETDTDDGSGLLFIPRSKTDQSGEGAHAWVSPETMRAIADWRTAAGIEHGLLFRRVHVQRTQAQDARPEQRARALAPQRHISWQAMQATPARLATEAQTIGSDVLTRQGVTHILRRIARKAVAIGLVAIEPSQLEQRLAALSTHSLRVGLTQDLFAAGEDAGPITQALRWRSPVTALRYGRKLQVGANAAARVLGKVRG